MKPKFLDAVPVGRIFLKLDNPRHEPFDTEGAAIEYLCDHENVYPLARDIIKNGLNPLERFALIPVDKKKAGRSDASYTVAEGNRRLCAIKLLADPDLAPARLRKSFERLAEQWTPIKTVPAAVFSDFDAAKLWLFRVHNGAQGGIGRKDWNSDQKQRFDGGSKNKAALEFLDYAEKEGMITAAQRRGKLTTAQRFLGNDVFREMLGLDVSNPDQVGRTRPKAEFDIIAKRFVKDLVERKQVHSRMNRDEIVKYARPLSSLAGVSSVRIEPESLTAAGTTKGGRKKPRAKPVKPERVKHVAYDEAIALALKALGNEKLISLYHSICSVELEHHTPMVAIGTWSFLETLTALAGRNDSTSMDAWLSKTKIQSYGIAGDTVTLQAVMKRVREYGNTTKHHPIAALFNGDQLNNDVQTLRPVILKAIEEAASKGV